MADWQIPWPWCRHQWEAIERIRVFERPSAQRPCEMIFVLRCKKCGDLRKRRIE